MAEPKWRSTISEMLAADVCGMRLLDEIVDAESYDRLASELKMANKNYETLKHGNDLLSAEYVSMRDELADKAKEMETMIHVSLYDEMCEMKDKEIERLRCVANDLVDSADYMLNAFGEHFGHCECMADFECEPEPDCTICHGTRWPVEEHSLCVALFTAESNVRKAKAALASK